MKMERKLKIIFAVLAVFYAAGIIGLSIDAIREITIVFTPFNLVSTALLFIWGLAPVSENFWTTAALVFLTSFLLEAVGVETAFLFGEYYYGSPLGWKVFDVPLIIGVNWFILSFAASGVAMRFTSNYLAAVVLASSLMVVLDLLIEPVAITLDFWQWGTPPSGETTVLAKNYEVPIQNYFMWFLSAFVINALILRRVKRLNFPISAYILGLQYLFFGILNLLL